MSKVKGQGLREQDLKTLDPSKLTPLSPEVISRQATINIGTIGHVAHGKSTVVKAISGVQTVRFKNELERNITIKLGYANAKIYQCGSCERPACFRAYGSNKEDTPPCEQPAGCGAGGGGDEAGLPSGAALPAALPVAHAAAPPAPGGCLVRQCAAAAGRAGGAAACG